MRLLSKWLALLSLATFTVALTQEESDQVIRQSLDAYRARENRENALDFIPSEFVDLVPVAKNFNIMKPLKTTKVCKLFRE